ncbi:hypothetical protein QUG92_01605 [Curtobacterium sp. RHCKG23]|uniref:Uncharacterized protein n=1 Tax=Curtobacterium citri TaxID=3055139 RepID=A0ABT7T2I0_9MICO|nr:MULTISPECIES: hypothetical protein [Curtobacterium]MDM7883790.1 hypothetical protein [Curtobacterium citri]OEI68592.1 hypothetical protein Cus16_1691 [Curtobacterium sp. ER1/6]
MSRVDVVRAAARGSRTAQQYDPLGAMGSRPLAVVLGAGGVLWALLVSLLDRDVPGSPTLSALTVLVLAASGAVVVTASSPFRAPFPRWAYVVHVALLAVATVSSVAAQWGPDRNALNDFMCLLTATGIVVVAPYRPWRDLAVGGLVLAAVDAAAWGVSASVFPHQVPVAVAAFLAAAPTLVLTAAAVVFAWTFGGLAERVQIRAGSYSVARAERDGIAASVQQDRSVILARDVAPFFAELRTREVITDADRARARAIADGIRRAMVADADRTWFEYAVVVDGGPAEAVDDPDGLIATLDADQRTVVRTFLRAALGAATVDPARFRATVRRADEPGAPAGRVAVRMELAVDDSDVGIHRTFDPYFAVLRVTFHDLDVAVRPSSLALRFSYDQH